MSDQSPGCHEIQVTSSPPEGGLGTFSFARFTVTASGGGNGNTSGPDLAPTAITFNNSSLTVGNRVHFDSGIRNNGDKDTGVFNIKWLVDGKEVGAYGSHAGVPKNTLVMNGNSQFDWTFDSAGSHSITFIVDVDNHVSESNENNNSRSVTVRVRGAAAPVITPEQLQKLIGDFLRDSPLNRDVLLKLIREAPVTARQQAADLLRFICTNHPGVLSPEVRAAQCHNGS